MEAQEKSTLPRSPNSFPGDAVLEHEDDGLQRRSVVCPWAAQLLLGTRWRQHGGHTLPEGVGSKFADHAPQPEE